MYGRKSGDPNTSLGNTIINAVTFRALFDKDKVSTAFMLGDDNLFMSNDYIPPNLIKDLYKEYGLDVKVEIKEGPYLSKFLQCYLAPVKI